MKNMEKLMNTLGKSMNTMETPKCKWQILAPKFSKVEIMAPKCSKQQGKLPQTEKIILKNKKQLKQNHHPFEIEDLGSRK